MSAPRFLAFALTTWFLFGPSTALAQDPLVEGTSSGERNRKGVVRADDDFVPDREQRTNAAEPLSPEAPVGSAPSLQNATGTRYVVNSKVPKVHRVHTLTMGLNYEDACATNNSAPWRYGISDAEKIHSTLKETATPGGGHELLVGKDVDRLRITSALDAFPMSDGPDDLIVYMAAAPGVRDDEYMIKLCGAEVPVADFFASIESRGFDRVVVFFAGPHAYKILRGYMDYTDTRQLRARAISTKRSKKKALSRGVDFQHEGFSAAAAPERGSAKILFVGPNNDFEVEDLGGSVFTYYLREALMGAAYRTRLRALTARGCVDYISAKLDSMTGRSMYLTTYSSTSDVVLSERVDYERVQPEISEVSIIDNGRVAPAPAPARGWFGMTVPGRGVGAAPLRAVEPVAKPTIEVLFKVTAVHDVDRVLVNGVEATRSDEGPDMWCVELDVSDPAVRDAIERYQGVFIIATDTQSNTGINIQPFDAPTLPEQRHSYALLIGTDDYDSPEWTDLANPILDAKTVGARLEKDYGFEVELLLNPTRGELRTKLAEYKKREYGPQDQLLIYIAGHGFYDEDLEIGHLVTRDAPAPERIGTDWSMTYSELTAIADRIDVHQKLLVLDVCFGGSAFIARESSRSSVYDAPTRQAQIAHYMGFRAQNVLTAGGKVRVSDGVAGQHSPFARRLLAALATHGNKHGLLTFSSLYTRVEESNPTPVRGTFGSRHDPGGEFTLVARPDAR